MFFLLQMSMRKKRKINYCHHHHQHLLFWCFFYWPKDHSVCVCLVPKSSIFFAAADDDNDDDDNETLMTFKLVKLYNFLRYIIDLKCVHVCCLCEYTYNSFVSQHLCCCCYNVMFCIYLKMIDRWCSIFSQFFVFVVIVDMIIVNPFFYANSGGKNGTFIMEF